MGYNTETLEPDSGEKQEKRLNSWSSGEHFDFVSSDARDRYIEVASLFKDAVQLKKQPKRQPFLSSPGHFPLENAGISFYDAMYNVDALISALRKYHEDFNPDTFSGSYIGSGRIMELLQAKQYNWAGHGVSKETEYQYIEQERMSEDEYDDLIADPTGFHLYKFLPRIYGLLQPLKDYPAIVDLRHMSSMIGSTLPFGTPEFQSVFEALSEAGRIADTWSKAASAFATEMISQGYTPFGGGTCEAPYDVIGDSLRGTRGISLDMLRIPDKLLQACEKYVPTQIRRAVLAANASNNPFIFMPLHKGAHSFMNRTQFQKFYWKSLRQVLMGMINEGLVPFVFAESDYNSRLDLIADLPVGRVIWLFEKVDMAKAKATVGQVCCIAGNLPNIIFRIGTPAEIEQKCRETIEVAGQGGGFILSPSAGLQGAKAENVKAMIDFCRNYS